MPEKHYQHLFSAVYDEQVSDGELEKFDAHLVTCAACAIAFEEYRGSLDVMHDIERSSIFLKRDGTRGTSHQMSVELLQLTIADLLVINGGEQMLIVLFRHQISPSAAGNKTSELRSRGTSCARARLSLDLTV